MSNAICFLLAVGALLVGYAVYGAFVARVFGADPSRPTPAKTMADGVDYVEMPVWKIWLVQLLNIAGVGPVFGPILGALYGPVALVWIVIGAIFAGAVHDYMAGMLSVRYNGANVPELVGKTLGSVAKQVMLVFSVVLLILVGVVFVTAPANMLAALSAKSWNMPWANLWVWVSIIFAYYFIATIMPIDKIIGRLYPVFGALLLFMALGITIAMFVSGTEFYNSVNWGDWSSQHPKGLPIFPLVFITIACGALSGFHSTQSPLMSRCLGNERQGRAVFYGGMIAEGFIGLVWATVGMSFYHGSPELLAALGAGGPSAVVTNVSIALLGTLGGVSAVLGVVVLPITSGDTAFRAARLTIAEWLRYPQQNKGARLLVAVPLFVIGIALTQIDFNIIWRYFGWANQTLATLVLFAGAVWLARNGRFHWICTAPAVFMAAVCTSYICQEKAMGFGMNSGLSNTIGVVVAAVCLGAFIMWGRKPRASGGGEGLAAPRS